MRFIFPALLLLNVAAAAGLARLHQRRGKGTQQRLAWQAAVALLAISSAASAGMAAVSRRNYPGGHALNRLHSIVDAAPEASKSTICAATDSATMPTLMPDHGRGTAPCWRVA